MAAAGGLGPGTEGYLLRAGSGGGPWASLLPLPRRQDRAGGCLRARTTPTVAGSVATGDRTLLHYAMASLSRVLAREMREQ